MEVFFYLSQVLRTKLQENYYRYGAAVLRKPKLYLSSNAKLIGGETILGRVFLTLSPLSPYDVTYVQNRVPLVNLLNSFLNRLFKYLKK